MRINKSRILSLTQYRSLCGYQPFQADDQAEMLTQITNAHIEFHDRYWRNVSHEGMESNYNALTHICVSERSFYIAKTFIMDLMNAVPDKRPTATEALNSSWISSNTPKDDYDLIDQVRENFNPRAKFAGAIKAVAVMNRMKTVHSDSSKQSAHGEASITDMIAENEEAIN
jgi:calcium/calmodulin-dependent protein kinase I